MRALVPFAAAAAFALAGGPTDPLKFDDVHLPTGVRLHYAEQGDPAAQPLILLHGYSDSWFSYSGVLTGLARNYHVYALDQRGHGDSDRPATGDAMADLAADVIAFMDVKGIERATIVGHSMGSFVARQVVAAAPERVARLVLVPSTTAPVASLGRGGIPTLILWGDRDSGFPRSEQPAEFVRDRDASLARS